MKDKYKGAAWNQLMENETKESIAEMYLDALDQIRGQEQREAARSRPPTDYERQVAEERRAEQTLPRDYSDR